MPRPLKVYRTPIGFHDAYIAVPTKKAAIEAWGAGSDIFQRGEAEEVTDDKLTAEPLASPGVVIKRLIGSSADHLAALGTSASPPAGSSRGKRGSKSGPLKPQPKPKPRPSRAAVDEAEATIAAARSAHQAEMERIAEREKGLALERSSLEKKQREHLDRLEQELAKAESRYEAEMRKWRG